MLTAAKDQSAGHQIRVQKAGGIGGRYKLVLKYSPRKGKLKDAVSNDPRYQITSSSLASLALLALSRHHMCVNPVIPPSKLWVL